MINILTIFFRNKKINLIYIFLFLIILTIIFIFQMISEYYYYAIAEKYGKPIENRTYFILEENEEVIKKLKSSFEFEEFINAGNNGYNVILKDYKDTRKLKRYFEKNNINGILDGSANTKEIDILEKRQTTYDILNKITMIIVLFITLFIIRNIFMNDKKNIALLKIVGYNYLKITFLVSLRFILIILISYILSILLFYFLHFGYLLLNECILKSFIMQIDIIDLNILGLKFLFIIAFIDSVRNVFLIKKMNTLLILNS